MAEKTLNTRIKLKYDSYANWTSKNPKLLAGEVAVVYIASGNTQEVNSITAPQVLFKVGDGKSLFNALPWTSAKAADVYSWAKKDKLEVVAASGDKAGNVIASVGWDAENGKFIYTTASVATSEGMATLTDNLNTLKGRVDTHDGLLSGLRTDVDKKVAQADYNTKIGELEGAISGLNTSVETLNGADTVEGSVKKSIKTAIDSEVTNRNNAIENAVNTEKGLRESADNALSNRIADYETNKSSFATKSEAQEEQGRVNGLINGIGERIDSVDERIDGVDESIGDINEAIEGINTKVTTLIGSDDNKSVRTIAAEELAAKLITSDAQESLDTLEEIAAWIQEHPGSASEMNAQIGANKEAIETLNGADTVTGSVAKTVKDAVAAETSRAEGIESGLNTRIGVVEGYFENGAAKTATTAANATKLGGQEASYYAVKGEVTTALGTLSGSIETVSGSVTSLDTRVTTAEGKITTLEGDVSTIKGDYLTSADKTTLNNAIQANSTKIGEHTTAITTLNGDENTSGSVAYAVKAEADRAKGVEGGFETRIAAIESKYLADTLILDCGSSDF